MENSFVYWFDGILLCLVSVFGTILNILAINVIWKTDKMVQFFHKLLITLFISDCVVLFTSILWNIRWSAGVKVSFLTELYPYFILPFNHIAMTASIFLTMAIAYERFETTRNLTKKNTTLQPRISDMRRLSICILSIVSFSIIFNIPKFLELKVIYAPKEIHEYISNNKQQVIVTTNYVDNLQLSNDIAPSLENKTIVPEIYISEFLITNQEYLIYYYWACVIILGIFPFSLLVFFIVMVYKTNKKQNYNLQDAVTSDEVSISNHIRTRNEQLQMTKVMILYVIVSLICHGLRTCVQVFLGVCELDINCGGAEWHQILLSFSNFFIILNSSINIIIYGFACRNFRKQCKETVKDWVDALSLEDVFRNELQSRNSFIS